MENGYSLVNVEKLAECLAKNDWEKITELQSDTNLYNLITVVDPVTGQVEIVREVNDHWTSQYWLLVEQYRELIKSFSKLQYDEDPSSKSADRSPGTGQW